MSTLESLIEEIKNQPEPLLREVRDFLEFLVQKQGRAGADGKDLGCWPEQYFKKTAGAFAGERFERPPQTPVEKREEW